MNLHVTPNRISIAIAVSREREHVLVGHLHWGGRCIRRHQHGGENTSNAAPRPPNEVHRYKLSPACKFLISVVKEASTSARSLKGEISAHKIPENDVPAKSSHM